ncbi:MAG TPA: hypothetical protein VFL72_07255, partial [Acidimicrobiia bacterium]|nr:hypothetical protein [Acidimicrobiia bacterium]
GALDCADDRQWIEQGSIDRSVPGLPSAGSALREVLEPYQERLGGEITIVDGTGSLVVDQREQVVAMTSEVPAGGWVVSTTTWCMGFVG